MRKPLSMWWLAPLTRTQGTPRKDPDPCPLLGRHVTLAAGLTACGPLRLTRLEQKEKEQKLKNKKTLLSGISFLPTAPAVSSVAEHCGQCKVHPEGAEGRLCKEAGHPLLRHRSNAPYPGCSPPSMPRLLLPNGELSPQRTA